MSWLLNGCILDKNPEITLQKIQVKLINKCEMIDDAFMVVAEPSSKSGVLSEPGNSPAYFTDGVAVIVARSDQQLRLAANNKYPGFQFEGPLTELAPSLELIADCRPPERIKSTLDSLRKQFEK